MGWRKTTGRPEPVSLNARLRSAGETATVHTPGGYAPGAGGIGTRRIGSGEREGFLGNADPAGEIGDADKAAGEAEAEHGDDANDGDIPAVGLGEGDADSGDLAADAGPDERPAGHGLGCGIEGDSGTATGAEPRGRGQPGSTLMTKDGHDPILLRKGQPLSIIRKMGRGGSLLRGEADVDGLSCPCRGCGGAFGRCRRGRCWGRSRWLPDSRRRRVGARQGCRGTRRRPAGRES